MRVFRFSCLFLFVSCTAKNPPMDERNNLTLSRAAIATGGFQLRLAEDGTPSVAMNGTPGDCAALLGPRWIISSDNTSCDFPGKDPKIPIFLNQTICTLFSGVYEVDATATPNLTDQVNANATPNLTDQRGICYLDRSLFKRTDTDTDADTDVGQNTAKPEIIVNPQPPTVKPPTDKPPTVEGQPDPTDPNSVGTGKTPQ